MKASRLEFRYRVWIVVVIVALGFAAPWDFALHVDSAGPNAHMWGVLSALLAKAGVMSITTAFIFLLVVAIVVALKGAMLRTWAAAYASVDGSAVDGGKSFEMRGEELVADGPYRYVRHPMQWGLWANTIALALLMPASGAVFAIVGVALFEVRIVLREEAEMAARFGDAYRAYCARVPRLVPTLRPVVAAASARPQWGRAALAEIYMWGTAVSFAVLGWRYNAELLLQCVLVCLGAALIVHGVLMKKAVAA